MVDSVLGTGVLGLLLGLRHAFEPDHLAAVSTLATRRGKLRSAARLGIGWSLGHTASVGAIGALVVLAGVRLPARFHSGVELIVALVLVLLGLPVLLRYARGRWHMHVHRHGSSGAEHLHLHSHAQDTSHTHVHPAWDWRRAISLGLLHGLAGGATVLVLVIAAARGWAERLAYFSAFATGTVLGMLSVTLALGAAVHLAHRRGARWATALHLGSAAASVVAGAMLASQILAG